MSGMAEETDLLTEVERALKERFETTGSYTRIPSTAGEVPVSDRVDQLVLPQEKRGRMPFTKDKFVVRENPHDIEWERITRQFCRNLNLSTGHRISAVMIYEWATGVPVKAMIDAGQPPNADLRKINKMLRHYYGQSYSTYIMGRKVPNAYRVPEGYRIKRHLPLTMALRAEYYEGVLNP